MILIEAAATSAGTVRIARAEPTDLTAILATFDDAVAWLGAESIASQTTTLSAAEVPTVVERLRLYIENELFLLAEYEGKLVGALAMSAVPPAYCWKDAVAGDAVYVHPFATESAIEGVEVDALLIDFAWRYALDQGNTLLRLDCFTESTHDVSYYIPSYIRDGFETRGEFQIEGWQGIMFEKRLTPAH